MVTSAEENPSAFVNELLGGGVELFKQRSECIPDFCFDLQTNDMVAISY